MTKEEKRIKDKIYRDANKEKIKAWREANKEKIKENNKKNYELNKEKKLENDKLYKELNKEKIREQNKVYRENNKDKIKEYFIENSERLSELKRAYNKKHYEYFKIKAKENYNKNKDVIKDKRNKYIKEKLKNNPLFKLTFYSRNMIRKALNRKGYMKKSKTHEILGCSFEEFKLYLESKFESWMNWDNYGKYNGTPSFGWDIDHKVPLSSAKSEEDIIRLNHYTNLQPLCSKVNRDVKRDLI